MGILLFLEINVVTAHFWALPFVYFVNAKIFATQGRDEKTLSYFSINVLFSQLVAGHLGSLRVHQVALVARDARDSLQSVDLWSNAHYPDPVLIDDALLGFGHASPVRKRFAR